MIDTVVKFDFLHILDPTDLVRNGSGLIERDMPYNDLRGVIGDKFLVHNVKASPGLGIGRKKMLEAVVRHNERARIRTEK